MKFETVRIRTVSNFIDFIQFHLICQIWRNFWVESQRTVSKLAERKRKFLWFVHLLNKAGP